MEFYAKLVLMLKHVIVVKMISNKLSLDNVYAKLLMNLMGPIVNALQIPKMIMVLANVIWDILIQMLLIVKDVLIIARYAQTFTIVLNVLLITESIKQMDNVFKTVIQSILNKIKCVCHAI